MTDEITRAWIRNRSDELAAENGCIFDAERGQEVCDWIEQHCHLYEGTNRQLILADWQREATMRMFGWLKWCDHMPSGAPPRWIRRFSKAGIWLPKKAGKSPMAAAWALYLLLGDGEPGQHVFFAAADGGQARIVAKHAYEMVKASPLLDADQGGEVGVNLSEMRLIHERSRSDAKPISSGDKIAAQRKQGVNGSVVMDELHVINDAFVSESSIDMAGISRDEPFHIEISTAGKDPDSYGRKRYLYGKKVESGEEVNERFFFLCYEAPQDLKDEDLDADPLKWGRIANPMLGKIQREDDYLAMYHEKKKSLADLADFKTFRLNIWQTTATPWVRMEDWRRCEQRFGESELEGLTCCAGLDLGITRDMSALAFCFPLEDEAFRLLVKFYMAEDAARTLAVRVPQVEEWVRGGWLVTTPGDTTDYRFLLREFVRLTKLFQVRLLVFDPRFAEQITQEMSEQTGVPREKFIQRSGLYNESTQNFERAVIQGKMHHNGNPLMTWQMGHTNIATDKHGNQMPVKPEREDHKKIDGVVAAIEAFAAARVPDPNVNWFMAGGGLFGRGIDAPVEAR